ncbi:hypothetical protein ACCO40_06610 [Bacillus spizizenii]|uniref:hypothetical protein n=1 Tax=Bacillus spizizenii TaxID=96241 RepID=UPI000DEEE7BC
MSRKLGESRVILNYLENRYGKIYNLTMDEEKELQKSIILDHDKDDLKKMFNRVEGSINIAKDSQALNVQPFSFFMAMITVFSSASVGLIAAFMTMLNSLFGKYLDGEDIKKDEISDLLNSFDFSSIYYPVVWSIAGPFVVVLIYWLFFYRRTTAKIDKRYYVNVLLKECIDDYEKVKHKVEHIEE